MILQLNKSGALSKIEKIKLLHIDFYLYYSLIDPCVLSLSSLYNWFCDKQTGHFVCVLISFYCDRITSLFVPNIFIYARLILFSVADQFK